MTFISVIQSGSTQRITDEPIKTVRVGSDVRALFKLVRPGIKLDNILRRIAFARP